MPRRATRWTAVAVAALLGAAPGAAGADLSGSLVTDGRGPGLLVTPPQAVAVNTANGTQYTSNGERTYRYDRYGRLLGSFALGATSLAVNPNTGHVYGTTGDHVVQHGATGGFLRRWAVPGGAWGLAVDPATGDVYTGSSTVSRYSATGAFKRAFGSFTLATGIAVDPARQRVYVADAFAWRIVAFRPDGDFVLTWGRGVDKTTGGDVCTVVSGHTCGAGAQGSGPLHFGGRGTYALRVAVDPAGFVLVADTGAWRVTQFDHSPSFVRMWGTAVDRTTGRNLCFAFTGHECGTGGFADERTPYLGQLFYPQDIAVDPARRAFVVASDGLKRFAGADPVRHEDAVLNTEPVLGFWRLGEPAGAPSARDHTGTAAGRHVGGVTRGVAGAIPGDAAARFDGSSGHVLVPDPLGFLSPDPSGFTVEAWLQPSRLNRVNGILNKGSIQVYLDARNRLTLRRTGDGIVAVAATALADTTRFHHVAVTFDGAAGPRLHLDGSDVTGATSTRRAFDRSTSNLVIGAGAGYFSGVLDEVALYNRALTPEEVRAHVAAAGEPRDPD